MKFFQLLLILFTPFLIAQTLKVPFETNSNTTPTYQEVIQFYKTLEKSHKQLQIKEWGLTDVGQPIHSAVLSLDGIFDSEIAKQKNKRILFINNAIHAGEPCGVDATMLLYKNILENKALKKALKNVILVAIPVYNIGGNLNRNSHTRANQNGPEVYGFRANAKNLDLNRDFIKCDSKNAQTFNKLFTYWQPDVFVDNHTSNGADYQYTMTLIATQKDKLNPHLSQFLTTKLLPKLYTDMAAKNYELTPYVYVRNTPDDGIAGFLDLPRYASGYAALHNCLSFTSEAHMLKPYKNRVLGTYALMETLIEFTHKNAKAIKSVREKALQSIKNESNFDVNWTLDKSVIDSIKFKGYEAKYKPSQVSGLKRLWYDHNSPYEKNIPYFNTYKPSVTITKPKAYIIPQGYTDVINRLQWNGVKLERLKEDKILTAEFYYIKDFKTRDAYESHYLHYNTKVDKKTMDWQYYKGDCIVYTNQNANRYIIETLEPEAADSFFAWNFFDGILAQKEYFSSYVFEDLAVQYLKENPKLKQELDAKRKADSIFAKSARQQLNFIYKRSSHYEKTHRLYPVGRIID